MNNTCVSDIRKTSTAVLGDQDVSLNQYKWVKGVSILKEPHWLERTVGKTNLVEMF